MLIPLLRLLARLPLSWLHRAGAVLGWAVYGLSPTYRRRLKENLYGSGLCDGAPPAASWSVRWPPRPAKASSS